METELLKPDDLVSLLDDPSFKELSFPERKQAGEMALQEASQWIAQNVGWTPEGFRDFGEAAKGFRQEIEQSETMWESTKGVAKVIGQTVADSVKVVGLTAADAVTVTDPSSSLEDLSFKAPLGSVLPSLGRGLVKAADSADVTVTALGSKADNAVDEELEKLRAQIDAGEIPLEREALESWLQERSDAVAEKQAYWYHDRRAIPPPTPEEQQEVGWLDKYQARLAAEEVSEETARAAYAQSIMQDPVSARLLAGYMQTRNPELIDALSSRLKTDPRTRALRDENDKARDADGLAKFLKANFGEEAAQLLDEAGDPMEWAGTVFAPLKGAKAIQRGRKAMDRATDLAQGVGGEMLSEQGSLQVDDPFATLERRREVARDTFFGALGLMGAGAGVKKLVGGNDAAPSANPAHIANAPTASPSIEGELPGTPPAPPTATAAQVEVDGTVYQYDPARITPDALRAAAPETLESLRQAGIIQAPPVATPSAPGAAAPAVTAAPGQPASPWAPPASAPVATPSAPVPSGPTGAPVPGQTATPLAPQASAPVATPSAPVSAAPNVTTASGQPATPPADAQAMPRVMLSNPKPRGTGKTLLARVKSGDSFNAVKGLLNQFKAADRPVPAAGTQEQAAQQVQDMITREPIIRDPDGTAVQMDFPDAKGGQATGLLNRVWHLLGKKQPDGRRSLDQRKAETALSTPTTIRDYHLKVRTPSGAIGYIRTYANGVPHAVLTVPVADRYQVVDQGSPVEMGLETQYPLDAKGIKGAVVLSNRTANAQGVGVSNTVPATGSGLVPGAPGLGSDSGVQTAATPSPKPNDSIKYSRTGVKPGRVAVRPDQAQGALMLLSKVAPSLAQNVRLLRNRDTLNEADYHPDDWESFEGAEGFYDPLTGAVVVFTDNITLREGESPTRAAARVIIHEQIGHAGLSALRQSDPAFAKRWADLVREVMADKAIMEELRAIAADPAYAELGGDPSLLVEEWFARQAEQLTEAELAALKPTSLLGRLWRVLKDALEWATGRFARAQWTAREVREILALSRQALERGESAATRPPGPLRLSAPPSGPGMRPSQFGERVQVDPRLTPETRAAPVTEFPIQRQQDIHNQARDVIRQQGLAAALATFRDDTALPIPLRIAGLMQVAQNFDAQSLAARATNDPARVAEADQLVEAAVEAKVALETIGNEAGRNLAMFNTWARLSPDGMLARLERKLAQANQQNPQIPATIPAAMRPKLQAMAQTAMALPEGVLRTAAMADLMAEFAMIEGINTTDLWWSIWYGNVLAGLATQSVNVVGSTENVLLSVVELGTLNPRSLAAYLRGLVRGLQQGAVEAWSVMKGGPLIKPGKWTPPGVNGLELMMRQGGPQTNFSNVREGARSINQWAAYLSSAFGATRFVGRLLGGMDAIFYYTAHEGAAAVAIQRALRKAGIKPGTPQFRQEVIRQMGGDPAQYQADLQQARTELQAAGRPVTKRDVMRRAWELVRERREQGATQEAEGWAARTVYQDELRGSGLWVSGLISQIQRLPLAGRLVVPFNQILSSMFRRGLDYTGLGLARGLLGYSLMDLAAPPRTGRVRMTPMERRQRAVAGVVGPALAVAVAAYASQFKEENDEDIPFWIYDRGPRDKTRRRQMPQNWQPFSIKVGKRYIRYSETPLGPLLAAVAGWLNSERYTQPDTIARRTNEQKLGLAMQAALLQYQDLGVLSGIAEFMDIINGVERPDKAFKEKGARSLSGLVPASGLMREIETLFDPTKIHTETMLEAIQRDIPIVSGWGTKPDLNAFSEPLTEPGLPVVKRFVTNQQDDPNWSWVRRNGLKIPQLDLSDQLEIGRYLLPHEAQGANLKDLYAARGWALAAADNGLLTREQRYHFGKRTGELVKERVEAMRRALEAGPTGGILPADAQMQVGNRIIPARDRLQAQVQAIFEESKKVAMKEVIDMLVK